MNSNNFTEVKPLCYWVQHILPLVYDDSLSYMELLGRVTKKLNDLIVNNNKLPDFIAELIKEYISSGTIEKVLAEVLADYMLNVKFPPAGLAPATGDGSADDTEAIQGCIDYAFNHGGMAVYFPSGKYLTQPLTLKNKATLFGQDRYSTVLVMRGGATKAMFTGDVNELTLTGLGFDGNMDIQVNNVNLFDITVGSAIITNALLTNGYTLLNAVVNKDLQLDNIIFDCAVEHGAVLSGGGFVQADNIIFNSVSALVGKDFVTIGVNNSIFEKIKLSGATPTGITLNGNFNVVKFWKGESVNAYVDNGTNNNVTVYTESKKEVLTGDVSLNAVNKTEVLTGDKTVTSENSTETISGDKTVNTGDYALTATGNYTTVINNDYNETVKGVKNIKVKSSSKTVYEDEVVSILGNKEENINGNNVDNILGSKEIKADEIFLNPIKPLKYSKPDKLTEQFDAIPMTDTNGNSYKLLVDRGFDFNNFNLGKMPSLFLGVFFKNNVWTTPEIPIFYVSRNGKGFTPIDIPTDSFNPMRDPSITFYKGKFYLCGTDPGSDYDFACYVSEDLKTWTSYKPNIGLGSFSLRWAPEWFVYNDKLYLYITAGDHTVREIYYSECDVNTMTFTEAKKITLLNAESNIHIDPNLITHNGNIYMFLTNGNGYVELWLGNTLNTFTPIIQGDNSTIFPQYVEGVSAVNVNNKVLIYGDRYTHNNNTIQSTILTSTDDFTRFSPLVECVSNNRDGRKSGMSHGTVLKLNKESLPILLNMEFSILDEALEDNTMQAVYLNDLMTLNGVIYSIPTLTLLPNVVYKVKDSGNVNVNRFVIDNIYNPYKLKSFNIVNDDTTYKLIFIKSTGSYAIFNKKFECANITLYNDLPISNYGEFRFNTLQTTGHVFLFEFKLNVKYSSAGFILNVSIKDEMEPLTILFKVKQHTLGNFTVSCVPLNKNDNIANVVEWGVTNNYLNISGDITNNLMNISVSSIYGVGFIPNINQYIGLITPRIEGATKIFKTTGYNTQGG